MSCRSRKSDDVSPLVIDVQQLPCPVSFIRVKQAMRTINSGNPVTVHCADFVIALDVVAWARNRGWEAVISPNSSTTVIVTKT